MRIYRHYGKGHYIGSCIIVAANDEDEARAMIRTELDNMGLKEEKVADFLHPLPILFHGIVYSDSGDY